MAISRKKLIFLLCTLTVGSAVALFSPRAPLPENVLVEFPERKTAPEQNSIFLRIPNEYMGFYAYPTLKSRDMNLFGYYPDFSSASNPKNRSYLSGNCVGYCNGRLMISIENTGLPPTYPNSVSVEARGFLEPPRVFKATKGRRPPPVIKRFEQRPEFGFDKIFDDIAYIEDGEKITTHKRFMLRSVDDGVNYDAAARCDMKAKYVHCILLFSPQCEPRILVHLTSWEYGRMNEALDVMRGAENLVAGWIESNKCKRELKL